MAYDFKKLSEVETQDKPSESTTVMAFESGQPKQIPASEFGGKGLVVDLRSYTMNTDGTATTISDISYDPIYEAIMAGQHVSLLISFEEMDVFTQVLISHFLPGTGFYMLCFNGDLNLLIVLLTNGSYHNAETPA